MEEVPTISPASLFSKMATVMGEIQRLPQNGKNQHFKYKFATEADVLDLVRSKMAEANICIFPSIAAVERLERTNNKGETTYLIVVKCTYTFCDGESGATHTVFWQSESLDNQDKGISKAITSGMKYVLMKTFLISTGDPQDDNDYDPPEPAYKKPPTPAPTVSRPYPPAVLLEKFQTAVTEAKKNPEWLTPTTAEYLANFRFITDVIGDMHLARTFVESITGLPSESLLYAHEMVFAKMFAVAPDVAKKEITTYLDTINTRAKPKTDLPPFPFSAATQKPDDIPSDEENVDDIPF